MEFIRTFFKDLVRILTEPVQFFRNRFPEMNLVQCLAFGVLVEWLVACLAWLTRVVKRETLFDSLQRIREQFSALPFWKNIPDTIWNQAGDAGPSPASTVVMEIGTLIVVPFQALVNFSVSGIVLLLGAMIFVPKQTGSERDPLDLPLFMRLSAVCAAPGLVGSILGFLPLNLGPVFGWIYHLAILMIGIGIRNRISYLRAGGIIFLPSILMMMLFGCVIGAIILALVKLSGAA
jgi:hypothetical protein